MVAAGSHGDRHLPNGDAEDFLECRVDLKAVQIAELFIAVVFEMHHYAERLAWSHRRFAEDGLDIDDAYAPHFEEIPENWRAASFQRFGRRAVKFDDIIGDQPMAATDELQRQLAFSDRRRAGDQDTDLQHIEKYAMQRGRFGQDACKVNAQDFDDVR